MGGVDERKMERVRRGREAPSDGKIKMRETQQEDEEDDVIL